jgi:murein DD-endopeptidase MepM/ murein hydrolase activator NlpD
MRTAVSFLIGCVFGATGVLMWVHETSAATPGELSAKAGQVTAAQAVESGALLIPVAGVLPSELRRDFDDPRGGGRTHEALDIRAPRGTAVLAVADGTIRKLFNSKAGGLTIYHYDTAEERCFYYAHLDRYADGLREGMKVVRGEVIGYVGTSGNAPPDTPHLHFGVTRLLPAKEWWKGVAEDPYPLLTGSR